MRVLHAATECAPFVKVGGLGDVMGSLPQAQRDLGLDARLLLPGLPAFREQLPAGEEVCAYPDLMAAGPARILRTRTPDGIPVYLLDSPFFNRPGGPYDEWGDSCRRFAAFSRVAADLGRRGDGGWRPEVLHVHDWQTALAPVYLALEGGDRPGTLLSIHNLAYQGLYPPDQMPSIGLPWDLYHMYALEFYGRFSFLKGGLQFADRLATVSPTYAREIQDPLYGEGLHGLLTHRSQDLVGILNGIDRRAWNPQTDPALGAHFSARHLSGKLVCKNLLQQEMGLEEQATAPLFAVVSRFTHQKGLDLVLQRVDQMAWAGAQLVVLGSGDPALEQGFREASWRFPGRVAVVTAFDEALSHRIMAGADVVMVPSRFEPCGLTQMYALAYGALPLVRRTGGLADTVRDVADPEGVGFVFEEPTVEGLWGAIERALAAYREPRAWKQAQRRAMGLPLDWCQSAQTYENLYHEVGKFRTSTEVH